MFSKCHTSLVQHIQLARHDDAKYEKYLFPNYRITHKHKTYMWNAKRKAYGRNVRSWNFLTENTAMNSHAFSWKKKELKLNLKTFWNKFDYHKLLGDEKEPHSHFNKHTRIHHIWKSWTDSFSSHETKSENNNNNTIKGSDFAIETTC